MARQLSSIDPQPQFRAVTLVKYSGAHDLPMQTYTDMHGNSYEYHKAFVFGPYEKPGAAKNMIKREERYTGLGYRNHYDYKSPASPRPSFAVAEFKGILEECTPIWGLHNG